MKSIQRRLPLQLVVLSALGGAVFALGGIVETPPTPAQAGAKQEAGTPEAGKQEAKPAPKADPAAKQAEAAAKPKKKSSWAPPKVSAPDLSKVKVETVTEVPGVTKHDHPANRNQVGNAFASERTVKGNVRLVIDEAEQTYDFGKLTQGESPSHTFRLEVAGEENLEIKRIKASCGCTVAKTEVISPTGERSPWSEALVIAPGSTLEVNATLKTENKRGQVSTNVAIYSNDDEFAVRRLTLRAKVQSLVEVEPPSYNFGQITPFDEVEGVVTLTSTGGPFAVELTDQAALREELRVELVAIEPDADGRATKWEARLALGPNLDEGIKNYPLSFKTDLAIDKAKAKDGEDAPTHEYLAYAMAQVQGLIYTTPNYSAFGMMRPGEVQTRTFRIHTRDPEFEFPESPEVEVQGFKGDFELPDNIEVVARRAEDKKSLEVDVKVFDLPEDFEGSFSGFVQVKVDHPTKKQIRSRFSGIARPGVQSPTSRTVNGGK